MRVLQFLLLVVFSGFIMASPSISDAATELSFGLYSSDKPSAMKKTFSPIIKAIEKKMSAKLKTSVKIKFDFSESYQKGIDALADGKVDFSRFGPASYVLAKKKNSGISILAVEAKSGKILSKKAGVIIVHNDSKIKKISDLKGKSFAFGNESSTIGRYLSQRILVENGITAKDLKKYKYLESHDKVAIAVARNKFDAGALKSSTFKKMVKNKSPIRSIAYLQREGKPWIARAGLPEKVFKALSESLLEIKNKKILKSLKKVTGFEAADDSLYNITRPAILENKLFFK